MRIALLIVAAGTGNRFGGATPKQCLPLLGLPVLRHAAETLVRHGQWLQVVGDPALIEPMLDGLDHLPTVAGGASRQASVLAGLEALAPHDPDIVLIHDAARPVVPDGTIDALVEALKTVDGAIPAIPVAETLKRLQDGHIAETVSRDGLFRAQTPQAFRFPLLLSLHRAADPSATDDAAILERAGHKVAIVPGSETNIKITYPEDMMRLESFLRGALVPRTGTGFDVHVLEEGRKLILCGIDVPHEKGLGGHSDADVGIHALCDAIYGAMAEGDIGRHFPPSQMDWKDADSAQFLRHAAALLAKRGGVLTNADVTLICEQPKITPHAPAMRARLADLLGVPIDRISVKATTTERLGFPGRGEGIAAQAVATLLLPAISG